MLIRIISYNIHKGFSLSNRSFVLPKIRDGIRTVGADLVFLQEVVGLNIKKPTKIRDWPPEAQFEFLADTIWKHHAYGKNAIYDAGHHGNAILSKYPITEWSNTSVSTNRFEHRGVLHAVVDILPGSPPLHCFCLHLGLTGKGRKIQLKQICAQVMKTVPAEAPLVIAGDFNDWKGTASDVLADSLGMQEVFQQIVGVHVPTYPAIRPVLSLDRIYCRNVRITSAEILNGMPWKKLSDHAALYAELELVKAG